MRYDEPIPKSWGLKTISDIVADISAGTSVNGFDTPASGEQAGVLKLSAVSQGRFFPQENKAVKPEELRRVGPAVRQGTLLISRSNTSELVGACTCIRQDYPRLHVPDLLWVIETEPDCDPVWMQYLFAARPVRRGIHAIATGTSGSMQKISMGAFRKVWVPVPPFPEQQKIAAILSTWDRAIELTEKLIAAKQKRKQALMQQLLTGKVRFKEFQGKPWNRVPLGKLLKEVKRFVDWNDDAEYHLLSIRRRSGGMFDRETKTGHEIKTKVMMTTEAGDFVIARMQAVHGAIAVTPPGCHGKHVSGSYSTFISKDPSKLHIPFLNYVSQTPAFYRLLMLSAYGVTIEKMTFNLPWFLSEKIDLPPTIDEQKRIAGVFVAFEEENQLLVRRLHSLKQQKKGLMQQLLTGKVRVNVDADAVKERPMFLTTKQTNDTKRG